mmetsp:Transcript_10094/g.41129  ORF Transcript_10094/g.41129 Transcript_10094/m.41129 type:complete len:287 (+) Transcript_10094:45-905(+)
MWAAAAVVVAGGVGYGVYRYATGGADGTGPPVAAASLSKYRAPGLDYSKAGLMKEMDETRSKPTMRLPVGVDLPRLCRKFTIVDKGEVVFDAGESPATTDEATVEYIKDILLALCRLTGEDEGVVERECHLSGAGEISVQLNDFIVAHWEPEGEELERKNRVLSVLKVCNQSLLAPAVVRLKTSFGAEYSYKDDRGQWFILIKREDDGGFCISHLKKEISYEQEDLHDKQHFSFDWEMRMHLSADLETLSDVQVIIKSLDFVDTAPEASRKAIKEALLNSCDFVAM